MKPSIALCPCTSSRIHAHGFDPATGTLALQFKGKNGPGPIYHYAGVNQSTYDELCSCESVGKFFGQRISAKDEDGKLIYPYTKIEPEEPA